MRCGVVLSLVPDGKSWRTNRTARHKPNVSVLLFYSATAFSSALSL
ncbi:MAG: hypothetical protein FWD19_06480 [Defluviitaleaceae bacterium]|nr:hypothetical protein [Defluviitaleaceae bacterium]